jgi:hypothetical protein
MEVRGPPGFVSFGRGVGLVKPAKRIATGRTKMLRNATIHRKAFPEKSACRTKKL